MKCINYIMLMMLICCWNTNMRIDDACMNLDDYDVI